MDVNMTFRHLEATPAIKDYGNEKLQKLLRFLRDGDENLVHLILDVEQDRQIAEIHLTAKGLDLTAKSVDGDMYAAIDGAVDKMIQEIKHRKGKRMAKHRKAGAPEPAPEE